VRNIQYYSKEGQVGKSRWFTRGRKGSSQKWEKSERGRSGRGFDTWKRITMKEMAATCLVQPRYAVRQESPKSRQGETQVIIITKRRANKQRPKRDSRMRIEKETPVLVESGDSKE
jgi:hypothetical protein